MGLIHLEDFMGAVAPSCRIKEVMFGIRHPGHASNKCCLSAHCVLVTVWDSEEQITSMVTASWA